MGPNFRQADTRFQQADYDAAGQAHNRLMGFAEQPAHEQRRQNRPAPGGI
jgi:hypothetical protein